MSVAKKDGEKKRSNKRSQDTKPPAWKGFIEVPLLVEHKQALKALDIEAEFPYSFVGVLVQEGFKVTSGVDRDGITFRVTMMDVDPASPTGGYAISGRGATHQMAFAACLYKHQYILVDGWAVAQHAQPMLDYG